MQRKGRRRRCSYCGRLAKGYTIGELAEAVFDATTSALRTSRIRGSRPSKAARVEALEIPEGTEIKARTGQRCEEGWETNTS
jgi:hypothetical protein